MTDRPKLIFKNSYEIRAGEVDYTGKMTVPALLQLMQEASLKHAIKLKASIWDLNDASWVLLSKRLKIARLPVLGEKVSIHTYPAGVKRIYAFRDYWMLDSSGEIIASASSTWTLMDLETRKLKPIPASILELPLPDEFDLLSNVSTKIRLPDVSFSVTPFSIGYFHLDWNNHVNNVHFVRFILESISNRLDTFSLSDIHIVYRGEALGGDQLKVHSFFNEKETESYHKIIDPNGKEIILSIIHWNKKEKSD